MVFVAPSLLKAASGEESKNPRQLPFLVFWGTCGRGSQRNEIHDFPEKLLFNFFPRTGLILEEFFQSVQTELQLKKSAGHTAQMNV